MAAQAQQIAPPNLAHQPAVEFPKRRKRTMPASLEGRTLGKYRIMEPLGRGGMAQVYRAYHPQLDRYVAIKVLRSDLVEEIEFLARFRREAQSVANLRHENVVLVHDFDVEGDIYYMVMELLAGDTLKVRLNEYRARAERMPTGEMLRITLDVLQGLAYAHSEGIIHRDIKPANILLTRRGQAVLTDFGIAQIVGGTQYTVSGALMGTLAYMAPEQGLAGTTGVHSDIYSLGVVFYEMLTGRPPYDADTPLAILMKHVNDPLPLPRAFDASIAEPLERVALKSLAKKPEDRFQSADEMIAAIEKAVAEMEAELPENVPDPDFTVVGRSRGVAVLSGEDRRSITDVPLVSDETEIDAIPAETAQKIRQSMSVAASDAPQSGQTAAGKLRFRGPVPSTPNGWQTYLMAAMALIGYNLSAVMMGLFSGKWRIYQIGWPSEILLVGLLFALVMARNKGTWAIFPAGIIIGNGILLGFYAVTGWWQAWEFLWPLEPMIVLASLGYAFWLGAQGENRLALTERAGQKLVQIAVLGLVIVTAIAALPFGL